MIYAIIILTVAVIYLSFRISYVRNETTKLYEKLLEHTASKVFTEQVDKLVFNDMNTLIKPHIDKEEKKLRMWCIEQASKLQGNNIVAKAEDIEIYVKDIREEYSGLDSAKQEAKIPPTQSVAEKVYGNQAKGGK